MKWTYFLINLLVIAGPLVLSFDKKVAFFKRIKTILWSLTIPSLFYLIWDIGFTKLHIWEFNYDYLIGISFFRLPLEEYFFFLAIPYACLFIYACLRHYLPKFKNNATAKTLSILLGFSCLFIVYLNFEKLYTSVTFGLLAFTLFNFVLNKTEYLSHALLAWIVAIIPMFIVNGLLTGLPVLIYNDSQNLGIRIGTIPVEDFFYNLIYMLWMIGFYERRLRKLAKRAELKES